MKLRLQGASIRLRLTQSDVQHFRETGSLTASTPFGPGRVLTYRLVSSGDASRVSASLGEDDIAIVLPERTATEWAASDQVGIEASSGEDGLKILVEKDFQCLHRPDKARDPDAYPHPLDDEGNGRHGVRHRIQ